MQQINQTDEERFLSHFIPDAERMPEIADPTEQNISIHHSHMKKSKIIIKRDRPITEQEITTLKKYFFNQDIIFISTFKTFADFQENDDIIPWGTHVWIADTPDHMIHFNGDRFIGPR